LETIAEVGALGNGLPDLDRNAFKSVALIYHKWLGAHDTDTQNRVSRRSSDSGSGLSVGGGHYGRYHQQSEKHKGS
jgi:hypothetical protein